jgi:hypothetical protein
MLEGREGVVHQLIVEGINQSSQEAGVAVANAAAGLPPLGVPAVLAEHASHLCAYSRTSVEITHIYQI